MEEKGLVVMNFFRIAEEKIKKGYEEGAFDHVSGMGKPLRLDHLDGLPEELRLAYRLLKNSGYFDEKEQKFRKELLTVEELLKTATDDRERSKYKKQFTKSLLAYQAYLAKKRLRVNSGVFKQYQHKIEEKFF